MNQDILKLLNIQSETQNLEFKRLQGTKVVEKIIQTIIALTNTEGGVIVIGIDDPEKTKLKDLNRIYGIEENLDLFDSIGREIQRIIPPLSNIKGFKKADTELVDISLELLETQVYKTWKISRKLEYKDISETLLKTGLAKKENNIIKPTRAAVLLFADHPSDLMDTKSNIRVFQYEGNTEIIKETPNLIGIPQTIDGPIINQIKKAHEYVLLLLRSGIKIPSGFTNLYSIPERAIKEAITNAVIHRDYFVKRDITVKIFTNRVEIENPGLFAFNITSANIGKERAEGYRNDLLVKHLREFPEPPNLDQNEGVRAIRSEMQTQNLYPPLFITYPYIQDSVRLVLYNEKINIEWQKISDYLKDNYFITNKQARKQTGITQQSKMSKLLKSWVIKGLLIKSISKTKALKTIKYRLA